MPASPPVAAGSESLGDDGKARHESLLPSEQFVSGEKVEYFTDGLGSDGEIVNLSGHLDLDQGDGLYRSFICYDTAITADIKLLPNSFLAQLQKMQADSGEMAVEFEITGEITRYRGDVYMLVGRAVKISRRSAIAPQGQ